MIRRCLHAMILVSLSFSIFYGIEGWSQAVQPRMGGQTDIRGQVRLPDGRPASLGIYVMLDMITSGTAAQTQTDRQGKFEFRQVAPADYRVIIRAPGYQEDNQEADLSRFPTAYLTFVLKPDLSRKTPSVPVSGPSASVSALDTAAPSTAHDNVENASDLMTKGNVEEGIKLLQKAVAEYPKYPEAYLLMGVAYSSQKKWDDAETSLQKSVELNQQNGAAYVALGAVENEKKKYPEAEKYLLKAAMLSPDSADVHSELGRTYFALERWQEADAQIAKTIGLRPDDAGQHVLMGNIRLRERNAEGALKEFQEALRLDPKGPYADSTRQMITRIETALKQAQNQSK